MGRGKKRLLVSIFAITDNFRGCTCNEHLPSGLGVYVHGRCDWPDFLVFNPVHFSRTGA